MKTSEKTDLLGEVVVDASSTETSLPDLKKLKEGFENEKTVISAFCQNCNSYHELAFTEAEKIFMSLGKPLDFENKYLLLHSCSLCKGEDKSVELQSL